MIPTLRDRTNPLSLALALACALTATIALARPAAAEDAQLEKLRVKTAAAAEKAIAQQGGSRVVFRVDAAGLREAVLTDLRDDVYKSVREGHVPFSALALRDGSVEVRIADAKARTQLVSKLTTASDAGPAHAVTATDGGDGLLRLTPTDAAFAAQLRDLVDQSIGMVEQRLKTADITGAGVLPDGPDRVRLILPGVADPARVAEIFAKKVRVSVRQIDVSMSAEEAQRGTPPATAEILLGYKDKVPYLVAKEVALDGEDINYAAPSFAPGTQGPVASFRFNARGTRRFAHVTEENIGKPLAIVLDDKVLAAPVIREPITSGSGQISGNFTLEEANTVAMMLRAGALPGHLTVVEQQAVEAGAKR